MSSNPEGIFISTAIAAIEVSFGFLGYFGDENKKYILALDIQISIKQYSNEQ